MKVLVIGSGGREHAIVRALGRSPKITRLICAPGNGGIADDAECADLIGNDAIVDFALSNAIDLVVVAPEDPLADGLVDALEAAGIRAFGPHANAAVIESSKAFSKALMKKYGIPTADYEVFDELGAALGYIREKGAPIVVKADGLAKGKGVVVAQSVGEAEAAARAAMEERRFGSSGERLVIEECLTGREVSVLCFTDGKTIVPMLSAQDHKRVFDGDQGPNTGGMGAFCPSPAYTPEIAAYCMEHIFLPTMDAMNREGRTFKGVLYFGLMLTPDGPKVIEYNSRFGDPEAQPILMLLKTDLLDIFEAVIDGKLSELRIEWQEGAACCVVICSGGYPTDYKTGYEISGLGKTPENVFVYHSGTLVKDGVYYTNGGRVLGVTATGATLREAAAGAYEALRGISFEGAHYRSDIGV